MYNYTPICKVQMPAALNRRGSHILIPVVLVQSMAGFYNLPLVNEREQIFLCKACELFIKVGQKCSK